MMYSNDQQVLEAVRKVRALRKLTAATGVFTKRSQGQILQALDPDRLAAAAELLNSEGRENNEGHRQ
jgi:hypothetical protein